MHPPRSAVLASSLAAMLASAPLAAQQPPAAAMPGAPPPAAAAAPAQSAPPVINGNIPAPGSPAEAALRDAATRYPPLIIGPGVERAAGSGPVPTICGALGGVVEGRGTPAFVYRGAEANEPELCNLSVGGESAQAWFGIWLTSWPGADLGRSALRQVIAGKTGDVVGFDVVMSPRLSYHDLIRNEGVEQLQLLGYTYPALKISHYREGFNGNSYRSLSTVWKDFGTGMILYAAYQHISGQPVLDGPLDPTSITLPP